MLFAKNISAPEAGRIKSLKDNEVLIAINAGDGHQFELGIDRRSSKVLNVAFDDVTCNHGLMDGTPRHLLNGDTAIKIIDFVRNYRNKNFIVHCAQGISRSAAVCVYIYLFYGHFLKSNFYMTSHPNPYVLGKLISVHGAIYGLEKNS